VQKASTWQINGRLCCSLLCVWARVSAWQLGQRVFALHTLLLVCKSMKAPVLMDDDSQYAAVWFFPQRKQQFPGR